MKEKVKNKKLPKAAIALITAVCCIATVVILKGGIPLIGMVAWAIYRDTNPFYNEKAVWSCDEVTIENCCEFLDGKSVQGKGSVRIDGVEYAVYVSFSGNDATITLYDAATYEYSRETSNMREFKIWVCHVHSEKEYAELTVTGDILSMRSGTTDHTGETFILYRQ